MSRQMALPGPALPPAIACVKNSSTEEFIKQMNKMPLFMTELDEVGEDGGENAGLEALKALAYEGEPEEVAGNFRSQGNECYKVRQYKDAVEFYTKALSARCDVAEINEACYANRAACNLELQNYRRAITDSRSALNLNPRNAKAWYRASRGLLALDKLSDAAQCASAGLSLDPTNSALTSLHSRVLSRQAHLSAQQSSRQERAARQKCEQATLSAALARRNIRVEHTPSPPDMEDLAIRLHDPADPASTLYFPTVLLYPLVGRSDLIRAFAEDEALAAQLAVVLERPPDWDREGEEGEGKEAEYSPHAKVDVFVETKTAGLMMVGKKAVLASVLGNEQVVVKDGLVKLLVVPKKKVPMFLEEWKMRMRLT